MTDPKSVEREAAERAQFLARTADLGDREAEAVAYREMGYTTSGIADLMNSTRGTVRNYLDTVAEQYGVTAAQPTPEGDRGRLSEPEVRVDMDTPTGRCVVVAGESTHVDAERYYRTWERDGRVQRDAKLAVRFPGFDDNRNDRLNAMDWDEYHVRYDDEYVFGRRDVTEAGAWTLDASRETIHALRDRSVSVPDLGAYPVVDEVHAYRVDDHGRTCPCCDSDSVCSSRDLDAFHEWSTAMELCRQSDVVTHVCTYCRRLLVNVVEYLGDDGDGDDPVLGAMH
jgi:DNA-binding CsgD family transcriptional regulator